MRTLQHNLIAFLYRRYLLNFIHKAQRLNLQDPRAWMHLAQQKINDVRIPMPLAVVERIANDQFTGLKVETKQTKITNKCILYFHGGGFVAGAPDLFVALAYQLSKSSGLPVFIPYYPLLPTASHVSILAAAKKAFEYLTHTLMISPQHICIGGDSAGGGLTLALMNDLKTHQEALPGCWFGLSPWVDLTLKSASFNAVNEKDYMLLFPKEWYEQLVMDYASGLDREEACISPLYADFNGFPPGLVQSGGDERLLDENKQLVARLAACDVKIQHTIVPDMPHAFQIIPLPQSKRALQQIGNFVKQHLLSFHVNSKNLI